MKARTNIKTVLKNNWILTIIILVNLIITLYLSIHLNIWIDEAYSLHTTSKDLNYAFWQALNFESQAPLYFILLKLWRMIDPSIIFARLFSVLCISAMIYFSAFAAKKYMNNRYYLLVTAAAAFNPFTIWAATEIRMYAFILLLSVLIMILFHYAYLTGLAKKRYRILYIILAVISLYTQYYMGFLLAANAAILLFYGRWNDLKKYIADMLIPVLSLLLLYPILFIQMNTHAVYNKNDTLDELLPGVRYITLRVIDYIFSIDEYSFSQLIRWIIRLGFIILLYFTVKKYFKRILWLVKRNYHFTLPAVMVMLSMFAVAYLWLGQNFLQEKHTAVLFFPSILMFFEFITLNRKRKNIVIWSLVIFTAYLYTLGPTYADMTKHSNTEPAALFLMKNENKDQPILIYRNELALPFKYYYRGKNAVIPVPFPINFKGPYDHKLWVLKNDLQVQEILNKVLTNSNSFWLLTDLNNTVYGVSYNKGMLKRYLKNNYTLLNDHYLKGNIHLMLYSTKKNLAER